MYEGMFVSMATPCDLNMFDVSFVYLFITAAWILLLSQVEEEFCSFYKQFPQ